MAVLKNLHLLSIYIRRLILQATTAAGSGHPSSSLSAVELMVGLMFSGVFRADLHRPDRSTNDRLVFSKGHAAPLLYALYVAAGQLSESAMMKLRRFSSPLEGHPSIRWPFVDVPTGSLGQGLSAGIGLALAARLERSLARTYVLLGDSEMAEGQIWEAIQYAGWRRLGNLTAILDVNRLGQSGPTMLGHDVETYARRVKEFGWQTIIINGHNLPAVIGAYHRAIRTPYRPTMIIAKTLKGKGVSIMENKEGWHGRVLSKEQLMTALQELDPIRAGRATVAQPYAQFKALSQARPAPPPTYPQTESVAPRQAFGQSLLRLAPKYPRLVVLDGEVKNSTYTEIFAAAYPDRFFQTYIAEQNMVSIATGLAARGFIPVSATFAAFFTRAHDQLRMAAYAGYHQIIAGTHAGVSIGQDGPSQMGLEDIAMFRNLGATVLYPADVWATERLMERAMDASGLVYLRLTRQVSPPLYSAKTPFHIGGSHTLRHSQKDRVTIAAAGITVYEALRAADVLAEKKIAVRVIDLYSVQPLDRATLLQAVRQTKHLIVVEDHRRAGGLSEAVLSSLGSLAGTVISLAVKKIPRSGRPNELLGFEDIDAASIVTAVRYILKK